MTLDDQRADVAAAPVAAGAGEDGPRRPASRSWWRSADVALGVAVAATVAPIILAAARGVGRGWLPVGDDAYSAVRSRDVFGGEVPLLGTWTSASLWARRQLNHPGPLQFDVAAVPARLLGPGGSMAFSTAAVNVLSVVAVAWLVRRLVGARAAVLAMLLGAGLLWSIGSEILYDPWNPYATLLPFLAFLVAMWSVASGGGAALPVMVLTGSYALQTHLSYVLLVPGLAAWGVARWVLTRRRTGGPPGRPSEGRRQLRWASGAVGLLALCWAQPIYQQLTNDPGNLGSLLLSARTNAPNSPGPKGALQAVGTVVGIPPFWLPPSWSSPGFEIDGTGRPLLLLALVLVGLFAVGVVLGRAARRAHDGVTTAGLVTAALAVALGFASTAKATSPYGLVPTYVRWLWPISVFTWTVLIVAFARTAPQAAVIRYARNRAPAVGLALAALTVVVGVLAMPTVDNGSGAARWAMPVLRELRRQAVPALRGRGPVLVSLPASPAAFAVGPGLFFELQRAGIDFVVDDPTLVPSLGPARRFDGSNARVQVTVVAGEAAVRPAADVRRIAYVPAIDPRERRALVGLTGRFQDRIRSLGEVPLRSGEVRARPGLERLSTAVNARRAAGGDLEALAALVQAGVVDERRFGGVDIARWADLNVRWTNRTTALLLGPVRSNGTPPPP